MKSHPGEFSYVKIHLVESSDHPVETSMVKSHPLDSLSRYTTQRRWNWPGWSGLLFHRDLNILEQTKKQNPWRTNTNIRYTNI